VLFFIRTALYGLALVLPLLHPAVEVAYDSAGWWFWFGLVPATMFSAFFIAPPRFRVRTWLITPAVLTLALAVAIGGLSATFLLFLVGGIVAFLTTTLIFKGGPRGRLVAPLELFFLGYYHYRMS
jgi:hypothetical protein